MPVSMLQVALMRTLSPTVGRVGRVNAVIVALVAEICLGNALALARSFIHAAPVVSPAAGVARAAWLQTEITSFDGRPRALLAAIETIIIDAGVLRSEG